MTGKSLIRASELRSVSTQYYEYTAAIKTFKDKYFAIPGDMTNASSFWGAVDGSTRGRTVGCAALASTSSATCNGNGDGAINVDDWGFTKTYPNIEFTLPAITLPPNGYLILCAASNATLYEPFGQTLGIFSSSTYLTNSGSNLSLVSPTGMIVDQVNYSDAWYGSTQKKEGGWSLERIDPNNPCNGSNNWTAPIHPQGGTPGTVNSVTGVLIDTTAPQIVSYSLVNSSVIEIVFSEPVIGDEFLIPPTIPSAVASAWRSRY